MVDDVDAALDPPSLCEGGSLKGAVVVLDGPGGPRSPPPAGAEPERGRFLRATDSTNRVRRAPQGGTGGV